MISKKVKAFTIFGFIVIVSLLLLKFILWSKVALAPYINGV
jgi:hypothetical protein|tara:strand:+ start:1094 stop:1216 length:123 start_codon:yes stop_codon:yes gene_type:complete